MRNLKIEAIGNKIKYTVYCSVCGKRYDYFGEPFMSTNWDCDSKRCQKLYDNWKFGWFDIHTYGLYERAINFKE